MRNSILVMSAEVWSIITMSDFRRRKSQTPQVHVFAKKSEVKSDFRQSLHKATSDMPDFKGLDFRKKVAEVPPHTPPIPLGRDRVGDPPSPEGCNRKGVRAWGAVISGQNPFTTTGDVWQRGGMAGPYSRDVAEEVIRRLAEGQTLREIAREFGCYADV